MKKKLKVLLFCCSLTIVFLVITLVILSNKINSAKTKLNGMNQELIIVKKLSSDSKNIEERYNNLQVELIQLRSKFLEEEDIPEFIYYSHKIGRHLKVHVSDVKPSVKQTKGDFIVQPVTITIHCDLYNLLKFLNILSHSSKLITVSSLRIETKQDKKEPLNIEIVLNGYLANENTETRFNEFNNILALKNDINISKKNIFWQEVSYNPVKRTDIFKPFQREAESLQDTKEVSVISTLSLKLTGIAGNLAVISVNGEVKYKKVGDEIYPGVKIVEITKGKVTLAEKNKKIELTLTREYDKKEASKIYYRNPEILDKPVNEGKE